MVYNTRTQIENTNKFAEIKEGDFVRLIKNWGEYNKPKLKKDITPNYSRDIYKVILISRASTYTNQKLIIQKFYEFNKRTNQLKFLNPAKGTPSFISSDPLLEGLNDDKVVYLSDVIKTNEMNISMKWMFHIN